MWKKCSRSCLRICNLDLQCSSDSEKLSQTAQSLDVINPKDQSWMSYDEVLQSAVQWREAARADHLEARRRGFPWFCDFSLITSHCTSEMSTACPVDFLLRGCCSQGTDKHKCCFRPFSFFILFADFRCRACYLPASPQLQQPVRPREGHHHGRLLLREPHGAQDRPLPR